MVRVGQWQTPPFVTDNLFQRGQPCPPMDLSLFSSGIAQQGNYLSLVLNMRTLYQPAIGDGGTLTSQTIPIGFCNLTLIWNHFVWN